MVVDSVMLMVPPLSPAPTLTLAPTLPSGMTVTHPGSTFTVPELGVQTIIGNKGTEIPGIRDEINGATTGSILNTKIWPVTPYARWDTQIQRWRRGNAVGCRGNPDRLRRNQLRSRTRSHDHRTVKSRVAQLESGCRSTAPQRSQEQPNHRHNLFDMLCHDHPCVSQELLILPDLCLAGGEETFPMRGVRTTAWLH